MIEELCDQLKKIESGEVTLVEQTDNNWCAMRRYITSTGWTIEVFDDCGDFDYIDYATAPDGRTLDFHSIVGSRADYRPSAGCNHLWGF